MSNLIYIQDQPIINLNLCEMIRLEDSSIKFCVGRGALFWSFSNSNQALVAYETIKKARCSDLGKFDFTGAEVKDIYDRIN